MRFETFLPISDSERVDTFSLCSNEMTALLAASRSWLHKSHDGLEALNLDRGMKNTVFQAHDSVTLVQQ